VSAAVFELVRDDDYGVRDSILRHSAEYLSPTALRVLADRLWQAGEAAKTAAAAGGDRWGWRHWFSLVEMTCPGDLLTAP
jgi:hypothetical protein